MDVICDIDGTIADLTHRRHHVREKPKNWPAFFDGIANDGVIQPVRNVIYNLRNAGCRVFFVSGRNERHRDITRTWLNVTAQLWDPHTGSWSLSANPPRFGLVGNTALMRDTYTTGLFMRADNDHRSDDIVKEEILDKLLACGVKPDIIFDDRKRVVEMWRRRGYVVAQVDDGDF